MAQTQGGAEEGGGAERLGELEERLDEVEVRLEELEERLDEVEGRLTSLRKLLNETVQFCLRLERDLPWVMRAVEEIAEFLVEYGFLPVGLFGTPFRHMYEFKRYLEDRWRRHEEAARRRAEKLRRLMKTRYE